MNNYHQKKLALAENPKTRWCCAALARLRFVIFGYASFFCTEFTFCKLFAFGRKIGLVVVVAVCKASFAYFWLRQFFLHLLCILQTSFVRVRKGLVVFVAICNASFGSFWLRQFFSALVVILQAFCVRVKKRSGVVFGEKAFW
jgi:hypothetical protein